MNLSGYEFSLTGKKFGSLVLGSFNCSSGKSTDIDKVGWFICLAVKKELENRMKNYVSNSTLMDTTQLKKITTVLSYDIEHFP